MCPVSSPVARKQGGTLGPDRVGGGLDALLSLCQYIQIFLTASFGILAAVARRPSTRFIALFICFLAMPFYLFDRTRNTMLSTVLPGLLAWVFSGCADGHSRASRCSPPPCS